MKIFGLEIKKAVEPKIETKSRLLMQMRVVNGQPAIYLDSNRDENIKGKNGYMGNNVVFSILQFKTRKIKNCPFVLYKVKNKTKANRYKSLLKDPTPHSIVKAMQLKEQAFEIVDGHKLLDLLENPSLSMARSEFYSLEMIYRDCVGGSIIYMEKLASGKYNLELLPSQEVEFELNTMGDIEYVRLRERPTIRIPYSECIHTRRPNPNWNLDGSHLYGLSMLQPINQVLTKYNSGTDAEVELFQNRGARGIITPKDAEVMTTFDPVALDQISNDLNNRLTAEGAGRVAVNSIPLEYINISMSPADLEILASNREAKKDICAAFGINPIIFDYTDKATYNNVSEAVKMSLINGVIPDQEDFKDALNKKLVPLFGSDLYLDYDYQAYPELQDDLEKQTDRLAKSWWLTANQKLAEQDFPPSTDENADKILVPSNLTLLEDLGLNLGTAPLNDPVV